MKLLFVSDFFAKDGVLGGAEMVDAELINQLRARGVDVHEIHSRQLTRQNLSKYVETPIIVSNFIQMEESIRWELIRNHKFCIYEHDHKYVRARNPMEYENLQAPYHEIRNEPLYRAAKVVFCQTSSHVSSLLKNIMLTNVVNLGGSLWSESNLDLIESNIKTSRQESYAIMNSANPIKNTSTAVAYCINNNIEYKLIEGQSYDGFIQDLSQHRGLVFFPTTYESCCRVVVEARMLGLEVISSDNIGAFSEDWIQKSGKDLILTMRKKNKEIVDLVYRCFVENEDHFEKIDNPKVSIITSVYKGDEFIESFMEQIVRQTYFQNCELIMVDCNSPHNEYETISRFMKQHKNIKYKKLSQDPGVYGAWNVGVDLAKGEFITNANLDDARHPSHIEQLVRVAKENPQVDLFYAPCFVTSHKNESFEQNSSGGTVYPTQEFSKEAMIKCLPGPMPLWRKSMHKTAGLFDPSFKSAGDWDMWLRAVDRGSSFKMLSSIMGLYYSNPLGLSTSPNNKKSKIEEERKVFHKYRHLFAKSLPTEVERYFNG